MKHGDSPQANEMKPAGHHESPAVTLHFRWVGGGLVTAIAANTGSVADGVMRFPQNGNGFHLRWLITSIYGWWWLEHDWIMTFHSAGNVIFPTDFNSIIFQRGWLKPPTIYDHLCYFTLIHGLLLPLVTWNDWQFEDRRFSGSKRLTTHSWTPCRWVDRRVGDTSMVI